MVEAREASSVSFVASCQAHLPSFPGQTRSPETLPAETFPAGTEHNPGVHDTLPDPTRYTRLHPAGMGLRGGKAESGSTVERGMSHDTHAGSLSVNGDIQATSLAEGNLLVTQSFPSLRRMRPLFQVSGLAPPEHMAEARPS